MIKIPINFAYVVTDVVLTKTDNESNQDDAVKALLQLFVNHMPCTYFDKFMQEARKYEQTTKQSTYEPILQSFDEDNVKVWVFRTTSGNIGCRGVGNSRTECILNAFASEYWGNLVKEYAEASMATIIDSNNNKWGEYNKDSMYTIEELSLSEAEKLDGFNRCKGEQK